VKTDSKKMEEILLFSKGVRKVPVIVIGKEVTIGFEGY
jgi:glutaredoxin